MTTPIFHIFLNSPKGRENLLQSAYFSEKIGNRSLTVFIPPTLTCAMYCDGTVITIDVDKSYLRSPANAKQHVEELLSDFDVHFEFYEPSSFTGGAVPDISDDWSVFACPRAISEKSNRVGIGHIGNKVRSILMHLSCPLLLPGGAFHQWSSVTVLFSGSPRGAIAVKIGSRVARLAGCPLKILTHLIDFSRKDCERALLDAGVGGTLRESHTVWHVVDTGDLEETLYEVPRASLVVVGTGTHSLMEQLIRGSHLETIQCALPNPLLLCGPKCNPTLDL